MKITDSIEKISLDKFEQFVKIYDLNLPNSYTEFILQNNGGYPDKSNFYSKKVGLDFDFDFFYSIDPEYKNNDVLDALDDLVTVNEIIEDYQIEEKELPEFLYPFGQNSGGATYCISTKDEDYDTIYLHYWDGSSLQYVCSSFQEFIEGLH
ncbi:SMI1/KNR4 family protein [Tenacibaculum sp. nBUS_03]|uniref:SMI1/KNR4 family protein n=1 Tax=Tenacibaculum sp. nBUS_03 TaxID=3395320 RepID=UPI003EBB018B